MPCGCAFLETKESKLLSFCGGISNKAENAVTSCNESPYCIFEKGECRKRLDFKNLLDERTILCKSSAYKGWLSGSIGVAVFIGQVQHYVKLLFTALYIELKTVFLSIAISWWCQSRSKVESIEYKSRYALTSSLE